MMIICLAACSSVSAQTFVEVPAPFPRHVGGAAAWGDYDNDGDLDLMMTGYNESDTTFVAHLYQNYENSFVDIGSPFEGADGSAIAWGGYDNDNDLDLLITGINYTTGAATRLYRNDMGVANTAPSAPDQLSSSVSGDSLILNWEPANDIQTRASGLTYNLRVGTTPGHALPSGMYFARLRAGAFVATREMVHCKETTTQNRGAFARVVCVAPLCRLSHEHNTSTQTSHRCTRQTGTKQHTTRCLQKRRRIVILLKRAKNY
jgi:hypothetical protein